MKFEVSFQDVDKKRVNQLQVASINEIFAAKYRALSSRLKARDLYDLGFLLLYKKDQISQENLRLAQKLLQDLEEFIMPFEPSFSSDLCLNSSDFYKTYERLSIAKEYLDSQKQINKKHKCR